MWHAFKIIIHWFKKTGIYHTFNLFYGEIVFLIKYNKDFIVWSAQITKHCQKKSDSHQEQRRKAVKRNVCNAATTNKLKPMTNLPSTSRYAVLDIPAISTVYFPVSSTFGLLMISLYTSFSVTILYFDPGNNSCKKMGNFFLWKLRCELWGSHSGVAEDTHLLGWHAMAIGK